MKITSSKSGRPSVTTRSRDRRFFDRCAVKSIWLIDLAAHAKLRDIQQPALCVAALHHSLPPLAGPFPECAPGGLVFYLMPHMAASSRLDAQFPFLAFRYCHPAQHRCRNARIELHSERGGAGVGKYPTQTLRIGSNHITELLKTQALSLKHPIAVI